MVNQNKGKEYDPVPIYNRKLIREVIRNRVEKKYGNHKVSKLMHDTFEVLKDVERA